MAVSNVWMAATIEPSSRYRVGMSQAREAECDSQATRHRRRGPGSVFSAANRSSMDGDDGRTSLGALDYSAARGFAFLTAAFFFAAAFFGAAAAAFGVGRAAL